MRHADLPAFPSFAATVHPTAVPSGAVAPAAFGASSFGGGYTPLGDDVAREVQQFIQQGAATAPAAQVTPQASWLALQALRQSQARGAADDAAPETSEAEGAEVPATTAAAGRAALQPAQRAFLDKITPWAQQAAQQLGVSTRTVLAHAALESGWGQRPLRTAEGRDALNLFGIKATPGWKGASLQAATTEYVQGVAVGQTQPFRAYTGLDDTFGDYVRLLGHSPRYRNALNTGDDVHAFASALAGAGYATDPHYADKLVRISRSIPATP